MTNPLKNILSKSMLVAFAAALLTAAGQETGNLYLDEIRAYQQSENARFRDTLTSPLVKDDIPGFTGLEFYPVDLKYRVEAEFTLTPGAEPFKMPTTTSRLVTYRKYGEARFTLHDREFVLAVYQNQEIMHKEGYEDYLFLPFKDQTNEHGSYGGGRYINLTIPPGNTIIIDFNKCYNPYCAYNSRYSCPLPPDENHLGIEIPAGVKAYHH